MTPNADSVESFFGRHAAEYAESQSHAKGDDLDALIRALAPNKNETALDVATGTGFTALALSKVVAHVTGMDVTPEMLDKARDLARREEVDNITFEAGDAQRMEYADASFDIVTTRRAAHHFKDVPGFLNQAKRVLKPGGRLGVVDMSPPEGAEGLMNRLERLRDSSHTEAYAPSAWESMLARSGLKVTSSEVLGEQVLFERWLYPVRVGGPEEVAIRDAWKSASRQERSLLRASFDGDIFRGFVKNRIILIAQKTP